MKEKGNFHMPILMALVSKRNHWTDCETIELMDWQKQDTIQRILYFLIILPYSIYFSFEIVNHKPATILLLYTQTFKFSGCIREVHVLSCLIRKQ